MQSVKQKPRHAFRAWFCLFLGLNILAAYVIGIFIALADTQIRYGINDVYSLVVSRDVRQTSLFRSTLAEHTNSLIQLSKLEVSLSDHPFRHSSAMTRLYDESANIACLVQNADGLVLYDTLPFMEGSGRYDYLLLIKDNTLNIYTSNTSDVLDEYLSGSFTTPPLSFNNDFSVLLRHFENFIKEVPNSDRILIVMAIRSELEPLAASKFSRLEQVRWIVRAIVAVGIAVLFLAFGLLVYASIKKDERHKFIKQVTALTAHIWLEFKLFAIGFVTICTFLVLDVLTSNYWGGYREQYIYIALLVCALWFYYFVIKDLQHNGLEFFRHNSIRAILHAINRLGKRYRFEKRMLRHFWISAISEMVLILLFLITFPRSAFSLLFAAIGIVIFILFACKYQRFIADSGEMISQISRIKAGDLKTPLHLPEDSDLYDGAINLNTIQSGMSAAVSEQIASERMKIDLITNVSHDLKTPLTSIISYIDLLEKEELPPQARDFVMVLSQKSLRLKAMIQDIFDVSKASSGNLIIRHETIDLHRLTEQTVADMQERIDASGLSLKLIDSEQPLFISSDGQKLYRVIQNLIDNALRYSLAGSRIYIRLYREGNLAIAEIKNTSANELDFRPSEITERFVRGDRSRTGDGSGLGLSIAQSFTEACGGTFVIDIEDDVFRVRLTFPLAPTPPDQKSTPISERNTIHKNESSEVEVESAPINIAQSSSLDIAESTPPSDPAEEPLGSEENQQEHIHDYSDSEDQQTSSQILFP